MFIRYYRLILCVFPTFIFGEFLRELVCDYQFKTGFFTLAIRDLLIGTVDVEGHFDTDVLALVF